MRVSDTSLNWNTKGNKAKKKADTRHIIWSNMNLNIDDDWRDSYKEYLEVNMLDGNPDNDNEVYEYMIETNNVYLDEERMNLDIQLSQPILCVRDLGLWNGRVHGYRIIESGNIKDCLNFQHDYAEIYVDKYGDLRADDVHHDGTNHYLYRVFKDGVSETQKDNLLDKIYRGEATRAAITRVTKRLGDDIAKVYGWNIPTRKPVQRFNPRR